MLARSWPSSHQSRADEVGARICTEPLSVDACIEHVKHDAAGAIVIMLGVVRNHTTRDVAGAPAALRVHALEYQAYEAMAVSVMDGIVAEVARGDVRACVHHRVGALVVGDIAVVVAASAAHRKDAFRACEHIIDRLKQDAPIWKREHDHTGVVWVGMGP